MSRRFLKDLSSSANEADGKVDSTAGDHNYCDDHSNWPAVLIGRNCYHGRAEPQTIPLSSSAPVLYPQALPKMRESCFRPRRTDHQIWNLSVARVALVDRVQIDGSLARLETPVAMLPRLAFSQLAGA